MQTEPSLTQKIGGLGMRKLNLYMYCLYITDNEGNERLYLDEEMLVENKRFKLDIFESEKAAYKWLAQEKEIFIKGNQNGFLSKFSRFSPRKIHKNELWALVDANEKIETVTVTDENCVRCLYFRQYFHYCHPIFPKGARHITPKEPIVNVVRSRDKNEKVTYLKESYFVTFPEIAILLFSREESPHYLLRMSDLKKIIEGSVQYR